MPRLDRVDGSWQAGVFGVAGDGGGQVVVYYGYLIPFCTERFTGDLGEQLLAFRKSKSKILRAEGRKSEGQSECLQTSSVHNRLLIPFSARSLFVVVMSLHQVPAVRSRPVIKMKWAGDPLGAF
ncbi:unnamed protein product [Pleuronectes platessa]|uniref:Uncharacterized protein n=1 Tax=Pleuronectes platessa TaxID=8262 RepID=A0A9N7TSJ8_PLEPL|nr:unnamed protein product [Pleuronectes platessa]